jgi:hypothetical protein
LYAAAIVFLILVAIFGLPVFTAIRWIFRLCIFALIVLFVVAQLVPAPKPAAVVTPSPTPRLLQALPVVEPSPTPKVLTQQEESQLFRLQWVEQLISKQMKEGSHDQ